MGYRDPHDEYDDGGRKTGRSQAGRDFDAESHRITMSGSGSSGEDVFPNWAGPIGEMVFPIVREILNRKTILLWIIVTGLLYGTGLAAWLGDKATWIMGAVALLVSPRLRKAVIVVCVVLFIAIVAGNLYHQF